VLNHLSNKHQCRGLLFDSQSINNQESSLRLANIRREKVKSGKTLSLRYSDDRKSCFLIFSVSMDGKLSILVEIIRGFVFLGVQ